MQADIEFSEVKAFLVEWGLFPLGPPNRLFIQTYDKMHEEATEKYGEDFADFVSSIIECNMVGEYYLWCHEWEEVENEWKEFCYEQDKLNREMTQ